MGHLDYFFKSILKKIVLKNQRLFWEENLPKKIKKIRCGISWKSTNKLTSHKKSVELKRLKKLFNIEHFEFVNLQYSDERDEIEDLEYNLKKKIFVNHQIDAFNDIDGVASLINTCDLIISVSNSNVHIAGKLGKKFFYFYPILMGNFGIGV